MPSPDPPGSAIHPYRRKSLNAWNKVRITFADRATSPKPHWQMTSVVRLLACRISDPNAIDTDCPSKPNIPGLRFTAKQQRRRRQAKREAWVTVPIVIRVRGALVKTVASCPASTGDSYRNRGLVVK